MSPTVWLDVGAADADAVESAAVAASPSTTTPQGAALDRA